MASIILATLGTLSLLAAATYSATNWAIDEAIEAHNEETASLITDLKYLDETKMTEKEKVERKELIEELKNNFIDPKLKNN